MTPNHERHEDLSTTKVTKTTKITSVASCSSFLRGLCTFVVLAGAVSTAAGTTWRAGQADVRVSCPLTIGGSFQAKTSALSGVLTPSSSRPSSYDGSLVVDLRTIDTGIDLRNEHLREKYLEVDKAAGYDKATLSEVDLKGVSPDAPEGKGTFTGSFMLHGTKKTVSGPVEVRKAGSGVRVKASFPVNLSEYNIPEPRYLGVGVKNTVQVEVTFVAAPDSGSTPTR
jgi:polyisoprenoid-binding protein YceI